MSDQAKPGAENVIEEPTDELKHEDLDQVSGGAIAQHATEPGAQHVGWIEVDSISWGAGRET